MRSAREPCLDLWGLVRCIVVHHKVHIGPFGHCSVNFLEKIKELNGPMALVTFADYSSGSDVERREQ